MEKLMPPRQKKSGPAYRQVADALRDEIKAHKLRVGDYLPSEREIAREHKVARITARGALRVLSQEGLLSGQPSRCRRIVATPAEKGTICLLFFKWHSPFSDPILADFCTGVAMQAQTAGYSLVLSYISESHAIDRHLKSFSSAPPRGMIVIGSYEWYGPAMGRIEEVCPVVLVGTPHGSLRADVIAPDFEGAMALAMGHVRSMGYERAKLLYGGFPEEEGRDQRNLESFRQAGLECGFAPDCLSFFSSREVCGRKLVPHESAGLRLNDTVLDDCTFPMAMVASAPSYATAILEFARKRKLRVPEDIGIVSTQDSRTLAVLASPVTAVSIYGYEVGAHAVMRLDERLCQTALPRRMERAEIRLTPRGSCGEPASTIVAPGPELRESLQYAEIL